MGFLSKLFGRKATKPPHPIDSVGKLNRSALIAMFRTTSALGAMFPRGLGTNFRLRLLIYFMLSMSLIL